MIIFLLRGNYSEALSHYERGLKENVSDHNIKCRAGIARCAIRCGDFRRGIAMATDPNTDKLLKRECAEILEATKVFIKLLYFSLKQNLFHILKFNKTIHFISFVCNIVEN